MKVGYHGSQLQLSSNAYTYDLASQRAAEDCTWRSVRDTVPGAEKARVGGLIMFVRALRIKIDIEEGG